MRKLGSGILNPWIVGLALLILAFPLTAHAADVIGKITRLKGTATIYRQAVSSPMKVTKGMPVHLGDRVKTGADSRLRIGLKDGSILTMAEKGQSQPGSV